MDDRDDLAEDARVDDVAVLGRPRRLPLLYGGSFACAVSACISTPRYSRSSTWSKRAITARVPSARRMTEWTVLSSQSVVSTFHIDTTLVVLIGWGALAPP